MDTFRPIFASICKIDEDQRMVFGYASTEKRDQQGEVIKRSAIEAALPSYMQFANIREMHQPSAVGVAQEAVPDDKGLWLGAKVVDDSAWNKVKNKVYKGFSVGGRVTARDPGDRSVITGIELSEISLVDRPANPEAVFEVVKRNNGALVVQPMQKWDCGISGHQHTTKSDAATCMAHEMMKLAVVPVAKVVPASELIKLADGSWTRLDGTDFFGKREFSDKEREHAANSGAAMPDGSFPIENGSDLENAIHAVGRAKDYDKAKRHIIARAHALGMTDKLPADWEGSTKEKVVKATPHLSTGKFGSHADAAKEHRAIADDHSSQAAKARREQTKHLANADKAKKSGDARGVAIHEHLAGTAAALAEQHDQAAASHHELASAHEAQAKKLNQENHMSKQQQVEDAANKASTAVDALLSLVRSDLKKEAINHEDEARGAREAALSHETTALDHETKAAESRENAVKAKKEGKHDEAAQHEADAQQHEATAAHHHEIADGYHDLHAHHLSGMGGEEGATEGEKAAAAEIVKNLGPQIDKCEAVAKAHDLFLAAAQEAKDEKAVTHHTALSKAYRQSAAAKTEVKKFAESLTKMPTVEGQVTHSQADQNGHGSGKNGTEAPGPSLADQHQTTTSDKDPNGSGSGKNDKNAAATMRCPKCDAVMPAANEACQHCGEKLHKAAAKVKCAGKNCGHMNEADAKECAKCGASMKKAKKLAALGSLGKGMNTIMDLAAMLMQIKGLQQSSAIEQIMEGDDDDTPAKLKSLLQDVASLLTEVVADETRELLEGEDEDVEVPGVMEPIVLAAKLNAIADVLKAALLKQGRSVEQLTAITKLSARFAKAANQAAAKAAKAMCPECGKENEHGVQKCAHCGAPMDGSGKMTKLASERDQAVASLEKLTPAVASAARDLQKKNAEIVRQNAEIVRLRKQVAALESLPMPSRTRGIVTPLNKSADTGNNGVDGAGNGDDPFEALKKIDDPQERNAALLKIAYLPKVKDGLSKQVR